MSFNVDKNSRASQGEGVDQSANLKQQKKAENVKGQGGPSETKSKTQKLASSTISKLVTSIVDGLKSAASHLGKGGDAIMKQIRNLPSPPKLTSEGDSLHQFIASVKEICRSIVNLAERLM